MIHNQRPICEELGNALIYGLGDKIQSNNLLIIKYEKI
jgi:hypothetical protein